MSMPSRFIWLPRGSRGAEPDRLCLAVLLWRDARPGHGAGAHRRTAREPSKLPIVLSADEVVRFLEQSQEIAAPR